SNGDLVAGTNRGMFLLSHNGSEWSPINNIVNKAASSRNRKGAKSAKAEVHSVLTARVNDIEITSTTWLAATSAGLFTSSNQGKSWSGGPIAGKQDFVSVEANGKTIAAATHNTVLVSKDNGTTWQDSSLSSLVTGIRDITIATDGQIFVAAREGAFRNS